MSAHSSTSSSSPIQPGYLKWLLGGAAAWACFFFAFTWVIDPYGVSPLGVRLTRLNDIKPKRLDIDRLVKPYEVWRYQPRTVFLGSSRIHQSIDPSMLGGTRFAPAYNASVPAVSLSANLGYLRHYDRLDGNLKTVVEELFVYKFFGRGEDNPTFTLTNFAANFATLMLSADALRASFFTLAHNILSGVPIQEVKPGGYFYYPPGLDTQGSFSGFPAGIWDIYRKNAGKYKLDEATMESVKQTNAAAKDAGIELIWIVTPYHAYFDYFLELAGEWDLMETWLKRLSAEAPVYSFSQPNEWVYENVSPRMTYWNDPFHFSLRMGEGIQTSLAGLPLPGRPDNFMVRLTPDMVDAHIAQRRSAIQKWALQHPDFVATMQAERQKYVAERAAQAANETATTKK